MTLHLREAPLLQKIALSFLFAALLIVALFLVFQMYLVSCPSGFTGDQCWSMYYLPSFPANGAGGSAAKAVITQIRTSVGNAYGLGQPIWIRFFDYFRVILTADYGYNVGFVAVGAQVGSTISQRFAFTGVLAILSALAATAIGAVLRLESSGSNSKRLTILPVAVIALNLAAAGAFIWGMNSALHPGGSNWALSFLGNFVFAPFGHYYVPLGVATLLKSGFAYDIAYLQAMSEPFLFLTSVALLSLILVRLANRGGVYFMTAFCASLLSVLAWALVVEPLYGWPGIGQGVYFSEVADNLPLGQAAVLSVCLIFLAAAFCAYFARDAVAFIGHLFSRRATPAVGGPASEFRERPAGIALLAILQFVGGILLVFVSLVIWATSPWVAGDFLLLLFCLLLAYAALGLWSGKSWAWPLNVVLVVLGIILGSIGIALGAFAEVGGLAAGLIILWYLFRPSVRQFYMREDRLSVQPR